MKIKKILSVIFVIGMFLLVSSLDTVETTSQADITSAQIQAEINRNSK